MRKQRIQKILTEKFQNGLIDIVDESHKHAGRAGQESHFKVLIQSDEFKGQSRVQRQRLVQNLLSEEFKSGLHALSLRLLTKEEADKNTQFESPNCQGSKK